MFLTDIDEMLLGNQPLVFVMPYEFDDINIQDFKNYNRERYAKRFQSIDSDEHEFTDGDITLTEYYLGCGDEDSNLIPNGLFLDLIKFMLIDLESMSFVSLFSGYTYFYKTEKCNQYFDYFMNLLENANSTVAVDNVRRYMIELFEEQRAWVDHQYYGDHLLSQVNLEKLQKIRTD